MDESTKGTTNDIALRCRFEFAPPRHFLYPALLLVLAEESRHGYGLVEELQGLRFGHVDRPSVYRALAQLQHDGLLHSWEATATAGPSRVVYALTPGGRRALQAWMRVVADEEACLTRVLERYNSCDPPSRNSTQANGKTDGRAGTKRMRRQA